MTRNPNEVAQDYGLEYDPKKIVIRHGLINRFWHRYNTDKTFQRFIDSCILFFGTGFVTIAVMTILMVCL